MQGFLHFALVCKLVIISGMPVKVRVRDFSNRLFNIPVTDTPEILQIVDKHNDMGSFYGDICTIRSTKLPLSKNKLLPQASKLLASLISRGHQQHWKTRRPRTRENRYLYPTHLLSI